MAALTATLWRPALAVSALVAYALLSNALMVHAPNHPWTVALLFGPLLLAVGGLGWQRRQWWTLALVVCQSIFTSSQRLIYLPAFRRNLICSRR